MSETTCEIGHEIGHTKSRALVDVYPACTASGAACAQHCEVYRHWTRRSIYSVFAASAYVMSRASILVLTLLFWSLYLIPWSTKSKLDIK
jgi:hypothetical protein